MKNTTTRIILRLTVQVAQYMHRLSTIKI